MLPTCCDLGNIIEADTAVGRARLRFLMFNNSKPFSFAGRSVNVKLLSVIVSS